MKDTHTILNEIIVAAKECGQVMLQADRNNFVPTLREIYI